MLTIWPWELRRGGGILGDLITSAFRCAFFIQRRLSHGIAKARKRWNWELSSLAGIGRKPVFARLSGPLGNVERGSLGTLLACACAFSKSSKPYKEDVLKNKKGYSPYF